MYVEKSSAFTQAEKIVLGAVFASRRAHCGSGMIAGTMIETGSGWKAVENVRMGENVYTYDGGKKAVKSVDRRVLAGEFSTHYPDGLFLVPGGALNNCQAFYLLPEQHVLIESAIAAEVMGQPAHLVPAAALEGFRGIQRVMPVDLIEIITLGFDEEEVVYANSGALLQCSSSTGGKGASQFPTLTHSQARALLELMENETPWAETTKCAA